MACTTLASALQRCDARNVVVAHQSSPLPAGDATKGDAPVEPEPAVAASIVDLLKSMGVTEFDDNVVDMLIDFVYSYSKDVLTDAQAFREAAGATTAAVELRDVELAIRSRGFSQPLPLEVLAAASERLNSIELPAVEDRPGLPHPAKGALTMPNFQYGAADESDGDSDADGAMDATDTQPGAEAGAAGS